MNYFKKFIKKAASFACGFFVARKLIFLQLIFLGDTATKTLGETINTTASIYNFLFTCVERVACTAHINMEIFTDGRTGFEVITATAVDSNFNIIWMDISFHNLAFTVVPPPGQLPSTASGSFLGGAILSEIAYKASSYRGKTRCLFQRFLPGFSGTFLSQGLSDHTHFLQIAIQRINYMLFNNRVMNKLPLFFTLDKACIFKDSQVFGQRWLGHFKALGNFSRCHGSFREIGKYLQPWLRCKCPE